MKDELTGLTEEEAGGTGSISKQKKNLKYINEYNFFSNFFFFFFFFL